MKEKHSFAAKAIETIRLKHELGRKSCLGYDNPPETTFSDSIRCPQCGGTLRYTVDSYNGETRGRCETTGCLQWAE